ncbi:hypothetical protein OIO90_001524 [Microbotryomycetes sp. JL221]|nr:hypothetical protein OIO90_001524 [Microbotryomycetes sp. JL221]
MPGPSSDPTIGASATCSNDNAGSMTPPTGSLQTPSPAASSTTTVIDSQLRARAAEDTPNKVEQQAEAVAEAAAALDIEHLPVEDDPRQWSPLRKNLILATVAFCAMGGTMTASIVFPALEQVQQDLRATDDQVAATASVFIAGQGIFPIMWSAIGEIKGRKIPYIVSIVIYAVGTAVISRATNIGVFIAMRAIQALGSGCVLVNGAGTLADIFDSHERGTKVGLFYAAPLVAPAIAPLLGGAITSASNWRVTQYVLLGYSGICFLLYLWLPETFRKERSSAWRAAMKRAKAHAMTKQLKARSVLPQDAKIASRTTQVNDDARQTGFSRLDKVKSVMSLRSNGGDDNIKIHLRDVNPLAATGQVLRCKENFIAIAFSGLLFASQYCITYTAARSFASEPYNFDSLRVGLVLLSFGMGNLIGSVLGGRYSDHVFNSMKAHNHNVGEPEMRIHSTRIMLLPIPALFIAYAWTVYYGINVAGPIVILFFLGLATIFIYSSLLAYVVDANPGRSSSAVACNSLFRGVLACVASQVAEPIIVPLGNGWFYSGFAVILIIGEAGLLLVGAKGKKWRQQTQARLATKDQQEKQQQRAEQQT